VLLLLERGASNVKLKGSNFAQMAFCNNNNDFQNESWWLLKDLEAACFVEGKPLALRTLGCVRGCGDMSPGMSLTRAGGLCCFEEQIQRHGSASEKANLAITIPIILVPCSWVLAAGIR
jgi:hypothetical protein